MEILRIEQTDDSPLVILDPEDNQFEISGKSLPEDVLDFYHPVLDWLNAYKEEPRPRTIFNIKLIYFNTASSKMLLDIHPVALTPYRRGYAGSRQRVRRDDRGSL